MGQWNRTDSGTWGVRWDSGIGRTVGFGGSGRTVYSHGLSHLSHGTVGYGDPQAGQWISMHKSHLSHGTVRWDEQRDMWEIR